MSAPGLTRVARALLRLLPPGERGRALADLLDMGARIRFTRGEWAARRACTREAFLIVLWSWLDGARRLREGRAHSRSGRRGSLVLDLGRDLRLGARALARRPGFTATTVVVLGLGVGANGAILTLADRLFLQPPAAVEDPGSLVRVSRWWGVPNLGGSLSYPDYLDYRAGTRTLSGLAAHASGTVAATAGTDGEGSPVQLLTVTDDWFDVLGLRPHLGRFFLPGENVEAGAQPVAVVSWPFWRDRLGGSAAAVGGDLLLNGHRFTVVGVAPREFIGLSPGDPTVDVYIPILMRDAVAPVPHTAWRERVPDLRYRWVVGIGRMRPGIEPAAVQEELAAIASAIRDAHRGDASESVLVSTQFRWAPATGASLATLTRMLLGAVGLLLAVAAANLAVLLLARASTLDRELGIRSAVGASRGRLTRQLLAESLLLGGAGCALGLLVALVAARAASALLPVTLSVPAAPDGRMVAITVFLSLATALIVGAAPAVRAARADVAGLIHGRDRHAGGGRFRDVLIVAQVALSVVLVAGTALFGRSFLAARAVDTGFDERGVLLAGVNLANHGYDADRGRAFLADALARLSDLPGVTLATATRQVPFRGEWTTDLPGWPGSALEPDTLVVGLNVVTGGYFEGLGIPLVRGRSIEPSDADGAQPVLVVNETFASRAFGVADPIGRTVPLMRDRPPFLVVGVVRDANYYELGETPRPQVYGSLFQVFQRDLVFLVRTTGDPALLADPVRRALHELDVAIAVSPLETLASIHAAQLARHRATAHVVGLSGLMALLLASAGIYGVVSWRVARRTRELGLRMALGATRSGLASDVMWSGFRLAGLGAGLGILVALLLGRLVESLLFGVLPGDPLSLAFASLVMLAVACVAAAVPARRATRIDPLGAMRAE